MLNSFKLRLDEQFVFAKILDFAHGRMLLHSIFFTFPRFASRKLYNPSVAFRNLYIPNCGSPSLSFKTARRLSRFTIILNKLYEKRAKSFLQSEKPEKM
jgi:hypothetical protein